jgi:hypothetical protein
MTVAASRIVLVVLRIIFAPLGIAAPHRPAIGEMGRMRSSPPDDCHVAELTLLSVVSKEREPSSHQKRPVDWATLKRKKQADRKAKQEAARAKRARPGKLSR